MIILTAGLYNGCINSFDKYRDWMHSSRTELFMEKNRDVCGILEQFVPLGGYIIHALYRYIYSNLSDFEVIELFFTSCTLRVLLININI